ncbi:hypothetical protein ACWGRK_20610 [Saccharomonospora azurea]|uniref:hypothetical protein n=1 Tax=Saccharomonospora azurea TaxID=40988 RepID=UPI003D915931
MILDDGVMKASTKKKIGSLWGYLLLGVVTYGWLGAAFAPLWIAILSALVVLYAFFQAPMWCCAVTRDGEPCRNNAYGILLGCHIREHKWQKLKMSMQFSMWGELVRRVLSNIQGVAASISAVAASASAVIALGALVLS